MEFLGTIILIGLASMLVMASAAPPSSHTTDLPELVRVPSDEGGYTYKFPEQYYRDRYNEIASAHQDYTLSQLLKDIKKEEERLKKLERELAEKRERDDIM